MHVFPVFKADVAFFKSPPEPTVRTELMEQIPPIAIFLQESRPNCPTAFSEYLMPIVVRYLTDPNNQVEISGLNL